MGTLSRADIIKAMALKKETVTLETGEIIVTEITADEYVDIYTSDAVKNDAGEFDGTKFTALLATRCIVDDDGKRVFTDEDADLIRNGSTTVYTKIAKAVKEVNGLGVEEKN